MFKAIQTPNDIIDVMNELDNANKLFFDEKLDGYNSEETQHEILKVITCTGLGFTCDNVMMLMKY